MASGSAERRGGWRPQALQDRQVDRASRTSGLPAAPPGPPLLGLSGRGWPRRRVGGGGSQPSTRPRASGRRRAQRPLQRTRPAHFPGARQPPAFSQRGAPTPQRERRAAWLLFSVMVVVSI